MEGPRRFVSGPGSYAAPEEFSIVSPTKSNISGNTYPGGYQQYQPNVKPDAYDQNNQYFPSIVEDLLSGKEEWRNIQEIIKMTMKAMCEVVRDQGKAIHELEQIMYTKANKSDLHSSLSTKANVADVSKAITEVATAIDDKASLEEVNIMMEDKMTKSELQYLLTNKVSIDELRTLLENK